MLQQSYQEQGPADPRSSAAMAMVQTAPAGSIQGIGPNGSAYGQPTGSGYGPPQGGPYYGPPVKERGPSMADVVSDNVAVAMAKVTGGSRKVGAWLEQLNRAEHCALKIHTDQSLGLRVWRSLTGRPAGGWMLGVITLSDAQLVCETA